MRIYKISEEDYKGGHTAPLPSDGASLDNLTNIYPDIYSINAFRYYGGFESYDNESISIMQAARGRPNFRVRIYRAVPDINKDIRLEIQKHENLINYYNRYGFFPVNDGIIDELEKKYQNSYSYDEQQENIYKDIVLKIEDLKVHKMPSLKINNGDWVTISRSYAKDHGESLYGSDYKILSKVVRAKDLYTDGNSVHEWGYHP